MDFLAAFVAAFLGTGFAIFVAITFFGDDVRKMPHHVSRSVQDEPEGTPIPTGTPEKRKPFYATPEKAALAEQGRGLPPQWQKRG